MSTTPPPTLSATAHGTDRTRERLLAMARLHEAEQAVARLEAVVLPAMQWAQELDAQGEPAQAGRLRWEVMQEHQQLKVKRLLVAELERALARTALRPAGRAQ